MGKLSRGVASFAWCNTYQHHQPILSSHLSFSGHRRILKEVSILLEALEKRQLALETENKQLREDLAGAANMIEEADAMRLILEQRLLEKDVEIVKKKSI
jgi:hypothetical protein